MRQNQESPHIPITTAQSYRAAYAKWRTLLSDDSSRTHISQEEDSQSNSLIHWETLHRRQLMAALSTKDRRAKAMKCLKLIYDTADKFKLLEGNVMITVVNEKLDIECRVWGFGSCADEVHSKLLNAGVSLKLLLEGQIQANQLASAAVSLNHVNQVNQVTPHITEADNAAINPLITSKAKILKERHAAMKQMLALLPNLSSVPLYTQHGNVSPKFWMKHVIENWPKELRTFTDHPLSEWTTLQCDAALKLHKSQGATWTIVPIARQVGALKSHEVPVESINPHLEKR